SRGCRRPTGRARRPRDGSSRPRAAGHRAYRRTSRAGERTAGTAPPLRRAGRARRRRGDLNRPSRARLRETRPMPSPSDGRARVSDAEWQQRVDLAACYRLVARYGWDDLVFTHISARVPGPEHHFLINPYGMLFEEITASSLVKIDLSGNKVT